MLEWMVGHRSMMVQSMRLKQTSKKCVWHSEASTAILCDVEYDTKANIANLYDAEYGTKQQTSDILHGVEYDTEK